MLIWRGTSVCLDPLCSPPVSQGFRVCVLKAYTWKRDRRKPTTCESLETVLTRLMGKIVQFALISSVHLFSQAACRFTGCLHVHYSLHTEEGISLEVISEQKMG